MNKWWLNLIVVSLAFTSIAWKPFTDALDTIQKDIEGVVEQVEDIASGDSGESPSSSQGESQEKTSPEEIRCTIQDTPIYKIFEKHPYYDENDTYPRGALTMTTPTFIKANFALKSSFKPDSERDFVIYRTNSKQYKMNPLNGCWNFEGKLWLSSKKSTDIPQFEACIRDLPMEERTGAAVYNEGLMSMYLHDPHYTKKNTGYRRTFGPVPPKRAIEGKKKSLINGFNGEVLRYLIKETGYEWDKPEDSRMWLVDIKSDEKL